MQGSLLNKENYMFCRHIRGYLRAKLSTYDKGLKELALASGYSKVDKFKVHCGEWNLLQRAIPLKYLDAIGAQVEEIEKLLTFDLDDFQEACNEPHLVSECIVRVFCAVYKTERFDSPMSEEEAIEYVQAYSIKNGFHCCIKIPELATISFHPVEGVHKIYYKPEFKKTKNALIFCGTGRLIGKTFVKGKDASPILSLLGL